MTIRRRLFAVAIPAAALLFAACGGGDDSLDDRIDLADPKVRLVHAIDGGPSVTLFRDGVAQTDATNIGYRHISPYADVDTQTDSWRVATATGNVELGEVDIDAQRGDKYTLLAFADGLNPEVMLIEDPFNKRIGSDDARVRVVNASANAPDIDVYLEPPSANLATATPRMAGVGFKEVLPVSGDDSVDMEPGSYVLTITRAGTKTVIFSVPFNLADNADWLLVTLPNSATADDIKTLAAQSDADRTAIELQSQ